MKSSYKRLGDYVREINTRNADLSVKDLLGINIDKFFMPSVANIIGTDLSNYKIVKKNQFACNRMHVGRDERIPIAISRFETPIMVSPAYDVFEIIDPEFLNPEYLMMWFSRKEFDRNAWFYTDADVRGGLPWDALMNMRLPIPSPKIQREIVAEYQVVQNRMALNKQLIQKLEETAQALYKQWFVDFEFPNVQGQPYKSSGGEMVESELGEIPKGWEVGILSDISTCLDFKRRPLSEEERSHFKGVFPYYGAMGIVDYVKGYLFDGEFVLFSEDGVNVIDKNGHPAVFLVWGKFWVNNHAHILAQNKSHSHRLTYLRLKNSNVADLVTGAAQPKINQENMNSISVIIGSDFIERDFNAIIDPLFEMYKNYSEQVNHLNRLSEVLLSKLATVEEP